MPTRSGAGSPCGLIVHDVEEPTARGAREKRSHDVVDRRAAGDTGEVAHGDGIARTPPTM